MNQSNPEQGAPVDQFDVFCHLLVEDFLRRKNMTETSSCFRREWQNKPNEDISMMSWYETALKLRLPEIISEGTENMSTIEKMTLALIREASVRARRGIDVIVQGLAAVPKPKPLPSITNNASSSLDQEISQSSLSIAGGDGMNDFNGTNAVVGSIGSIGNASGTGSKASYSLHTKKQANAAVATLAKQKAEKAERKAKIAAEAKKVSRAGQRIVLSEKAEAKIAYELEKQQDMAAKTSHGKVKVTSENWIPDLERTRSLERDFKVLKDNLSDVALRQMQERREMKQFKVTDLEKARNAESLGQTRRHGCGCCMLKFLPLNLPLRVSQKAVLDIRIKWGGSLSSKTVFGGVNPPIGEYLAGLDLGDTITSTIAGGISTSDSTKLGSPTKIGANNVETAAIDTVQGKKSYLEKMSERLSRMPRCYSDVPICTFCAQFFQDQEEYRPSYAKITFMERKDDFMAQTAKDREYWDPLKLVEKDREEQINEEEAVDIASLSNSVVDDNSIAQNSLQI